MHYRAKGPALAGLFGLLMACAQPAFAHHVMGGAMPVTWWQGLLSGLGHPVIGLDHLAAIIAAGFIAAAHTRDAALGGAYIVAMTLGVAAHVQGVTMPASELLVAASLLVLGVAIQLRIGTGIVLVLFVAAGFVNGYALGETIAGAEPSPLLFYFAGLAIIQTAVALAAMKLARFVMASGKGSELRMRIASAAVIAVGVVFLIVEFLPRA